MLCRVAVAAVLLSGCAAGCSPTWRYQHVMGPDGDHAWISLECRMTQANCLRLAEALCPHGYEEGGSETTGSATGGSTTRGLYGSTHSRSVTTYDRARMIRCRGPSGTAAGTMPPADEGTETDLP